MAAFEKDLFLAYATLSTRDFFFSRVARDASVLVEGRSQSNGSPKRRPKAETTHEKSLAPMQGSLTSNWQYF